MWLTTCLWPWTKCAAKNNILLILQPNRPRPRLDSRLHNPLCPHLKAYKLLRSNIPSRVRMARSPGMLSLLSGRIAQLNAYGLSLPYLTDGLLKQWIQFLVTMLLSWKAIGNYRCVAETPGV